MARLHAFRALRPRPDVAPLVASVPYDVVSTDEARALADGNPLSFLRVSRPELELPAGADPHAEAVYARGADNFRRLTAAALVVEAEPSVYFYRLRMGAHEQTGLAACFAVSDYDANVIRKHEKTRPDKEDDRTRHIIALRAQTGPVFLTYRQTPTMDELARRVCRGTPLYDFTAPDGVAHTVWRAERDVSEAIVVAMADVPVLYIADGHHRAASAARAHAHFAATEPSADAEHAWFVAVAFPDDQTQILPYHRVIKDLAGRSPSEVRAAVGARVPSRAGDPGALADGECAMYLAGEWTVLDLGRAIEATADAYARLDVSVLQDRVIEPVFGIRDVRTDKRIDFVGGIRGLAELVRLVDTGQAAVAFAMRAVTVRQLVAVSDAGAIMPPKSTWFEPKLRDGLLTHVV
ncbi:MAG: DUF1015 family protein [Vicinamibacterales bacterium]